MHWWNSLTHCIIERGDGPTIRSVLETLSAKDEKLDDKLDGIFAPTLVLWGENDTLTPLSMAYAYQRRITNSRLHAIPECGHFPCIEKVDAFVDSVTDFLR